MYFWTCWRGFEGVDAVSNERDLACGCVNGALKFTPQARVIYLSENMRVKTHMMHAWISNALCKWAKAIGIGEVRGPTWPFGTHDDDGKWVVVVFGMLWYVLVPTTPSPRVAHVGKRGCKSVGIKNW
jgi:hypothetical protein